MASDRKIWKRFKRGEDSALSDIYHQNIDFLYNYGLKFTRDRDLILDAIHDLYLDLMRTRQNLGDTDNIRLYLLKAIRRRIINEISKSFSYTQIENAPFNQEITELNIEEELVKKDSEREDKQKIKRALNQLSSNHREVLYYRFTCEYSYHDICEIMGVGYDTARQHVSRALKALKKLI
jgi:RNA polymerase sigma factor (sigma-70 family)